MASAVMRALHQLRLHGTRDLRMIMAQQEGAMTHPIIDVGMAVDIPFAGALRVADIERKRAQEAIVVGDAARKHLAGAGIQGLRTWTCLGELRLEAQAAALCLRQPRRTPALAVGHRRPPQTNCRSRY